MQLPLHGQTRSSICGKGDMPRDVRTDSPSVHEAEKDWAISLQQAQTGMEFPVSAAHGADGRVRGCQLGSVQTQ